MSNNHNNSSNHITKQITLPAQVWDDITPYLEGLGYNIPRHKFSLKHFLYRKLNYKSFIVGMSPRKAMLMFVLICKKLGVGFIPDSNGWRMACVEKHADELLYFIKHTNVEMDEVEHDINLILHED